MIALTFNPINNEFLIQELPIPTLCSDDVLIKVAACGLNPVDAKISLWKTMIPSMDNHWTPGLDVSGEIVAVGASVVEWKIGDRVLYHGNMMRPHGGLAEYALHKASTLIRHPAVSATVAAATPCAGWTAFRALHDKLRIEKKHSLLVTGGSGGVGNFAIQIAKDAGLHQILTTCSAKNHPLVLSLGATVAIDYHTEDVLSKIQEITYEQGVDRALDTVGGNEDFLVAESLAFEGEMLELVDVVRPQKYRDPFLRGLSFHQLSLGAAHRSGSKAETHLVHTGVAFSQMLEEGRLRVPALEIIALQDAGSRLLEMRNQRSIGKIVVAF